MKPLTPTTLTRQTSEEPTALLFIRLVAAESGAVLVDLAPGDIAISAEVGLKDNMTVLAQAQLIRVARAILNEMEAALIGGEGAEPGKKAVKA